MNKSIKVFAPATVANVACGFDILGFAVDSPGDEVRLTLNKNSQIKIIKISGDNGNLSYDDSQNTAAIAVKSFLKHIKLNQGFEIELNKKMPLSSGLGSSAASAVAAVFAANEILDRPLQREELLPFVLEAEKIACGSGHADNAAPALFGGFTLIRSYDPLDVIKIDSPNNLFCTIIHPQIVIRTEDARKILKKQILFKDAITQWGNIAGLISGLIKKDFGLIQRSMQDVIIEPIRSILIPGYQEMKQAALDAGALGFSISGSGPSVFAFSTSETAAAHVGESIQTKLNVLNIKNDIYISQINQHGPKILDD